MDIEEAQDKLDTLLEVRAIHNNVIDDLNSKISHLIKARGLREDALDELKGLIIKAEMDLSKLKRENHEQGIH